MAGSRFTPSGSSKTNSTKKQTPTRVIYEKAPSGYGYVAAKKITAEPGKGGAKITITKYKGGKAKSSVSYTAKGKAATVRTVRETPVQVGNTLYYSKATPKPTPQPKPQARPMGGMTPLANIPTTTGPTVAQARAAGYSNLFKPKPSFTWARERAIQEGIEKQTEWEKTTKPGSGLIVPRSTPIRYKEGGNIIETEIPGYKDQFTTQLDPKRGSMDLFKQNMRKAEAKVRIGSSNDYSGLMTVTAPVEHQLFLARYRDLPKIQEGIAQRLETPQTTRLGKIAQTGLKVSSSLYLPTAEASTTYGHEVFSEAARNPIKYTRLYLTGRAIPVTGAIPKLRIASTISKHPSTAKGIGIGLGALAVGEASYNIAKSDNKPRAFARTSLEFGVTALGFSHGMKSLPSRTLLYGKQTTTTKTTTNLKPGNKQAFESLAGERAYIRLRTPKTTTTTSTSSELIGITKANPYSQPQFIKGTLGKTTRLTITPYSGKGPTTKLNIRSDRILARTYNKRGKLTGTKETFTTNSGWQKATSNIKESMSLSIAKQDNTIPFQRTITGKQGARYKGLDKSISQGLETKSYIDVGVKRSVKQQDYTSWYQKIEMKGGEGIKYIQKPKFTTTAGKGYKPNVKLVKGQDFTVIKQPPLTTKTTTTDVFKFTSYTRQQRVPVSLAGKKGSQVLMPGTREVGSPFRGGGRFKYPNVNVNVGGVSQPGTGMGFIIPDFNIRGKEKTRTGTILGGKGSTGDRFKDIFKPASTNRYDFNLGRTPRPATITNTGVSPIISTIQLTSSTGITSTGTGGGSQPPPPVGELPPPREEEIEDFIPPIATPVMLGWGMGGTSKRGRKRGAKPSFKMRYTQDITAQLFNQRGKTPKWLARAGGPRLGI